MKNDSVHSVMWLPSPSEAVKMLSFGPNFQLPSTKNRWPSGLQIHCRLAGKVSQLLDRADLAQLRKYL